jgi:hypothetical protein
VKPVSYQRRSATVRKWWCCALSTAKFPLAWLSLRFVGRVVVMGGIAVGRIVVQLPQGFSVLIDSAFAAEISVSKVMMASF